MLYWGVTTMVGPRIFEIEEVNRLIPDLEAVFGRLGELREKLRRLNLRINTLELIWGEAVHREDNPDHGEYQHHLADMKAVQEDFEGVTRRVTEMGGQVKALDPPLVDFFGVRDGRLVLWCWTRDEREVTHWHHVDEGFAGRRPV